jgi:hypothetical protein
MINARLRGINEVNRNLSKEFKGIKARTKEGLLEAGVLIRRKMEPLIPIDTGNLRASQFATVGDKEGATGEEFKGKRANQMKRRHSVVVQKTKAFAKTKKYPFMVLGFTANYAAAVHERTTSKKGNPINYKRPGSGPKFLEKALLENKDEILIILGKNAKV